LVAVKGLLLPDSPDFCALHPRIRVNTANVSMSNCIEIFLSFPTGNTSRRYSHCGFTYPDNPESDSFECLKCEYQNRADYNAVVRLRLTGSKREAVATAKSIGVRYLRRNQTGNSGGVLNNRRLLACH
jgi:hypothetical protein